MAKCRNNDRKKRRGKKRGTSKEKSKKPKSSTCPRCGGKLKLKSAAGSSPKPHYYNKWISHCFRTTKQNDLNLTPQQTMTEAAHCWNCLTEEQRKNFQESIDYNERRGQPRRSAPSSSNRPGFQPGPSVVLSHSESDIVSRPAPGSNIPRNPWHGLSSINHQPPPPSTESQYNLKSWTPGNNFP